MSVVSYFNGLSQKQIDDIVSIVLGSISNTGDAYQTANNFSSLVNGTSVGQLAYTNNSEGTRWLPGALLGTYYPSGWYRWDGANWISDRNAIAEQLQLLIDQKVQSVTGTGVDNTDPLNPIINLPTGTGSDVTLAQFTQLSNQVDSHINNQNNPHITKGDNIPDGIDLVNIFNTGLI